MVKKLYKYLYTNGYSLIYENYLEFDKYKFIIIRYKGIDAIVC